MPFVIIYFLLKANELQQCGFGGQSWSAHVLQSVAYLCVSVFVITV